MTNYKIWINISCSNNYYLSIVCGDLNYEHCEILYHLNKPHSTLRKKKRKKKFWRRFVESVVFQKTVIESTFNYWIKAEYEYLIVHFMNGLLNQQTKSFFYEWIH